MRVRNHGFSLIEMMVASGILGIAMIFILQIFTDQHRTYTVIDDLSEAQQNGLALEQLLERDLRNSGFMLPDGAGVCGSDSTTGSDVMFVSATERILPVDQLPLELRNTDLGAPLTGVGSTWSLAAGSRAITLSQMFVDTVTAGDDFVVGGGVIITDRNDPYGDVGCGKITDITGSQITFGLVSDYGTVGSDADMVAIPAHVYEVASGELLRDGSIVAKSVEDLQVAYHYDLDEDEQIDSDEFLSDGSAASYTSGAALINGKKLREVRFNLVVATRVDPRPSYQGGRRQATENRTDASTSGADGRRRRVHTATVRMRNGVS